jgi:hypothetical protein
VTEPLATLVVLLVVVLGGPAVWDAVSEGRFAPEVVFYPVLFAAFTHLAVRDRVRR